MTESIDDPGNTNPPVYTKVRVILFKPSGKYYCEEEWRIPENSIGPYDMERSPDFRRISGGSVLVETQEPWSYPHLFPGGSQWAPVIEAERSPIDQINVDPLKLEVAPKTIDTYERVLSGLKGLQSTDEAHFPTEKDKFIIENSQVNCTCGHKGFDHHAPNLGCEECWCGGFTTAEKRTCVCAHPFDAHYDEPNSTCRGTYCRCHSFRVDTTKAEQSSSYYKSAQSERSSQFQEPQLSGRSQCKYQHGQTVANQLAHMVNTLKSNLQVRLEIDWELFFPTWLALLKCGEAECRAVRKLAERVLNNLPPELASFLRIYTERYSAQHLQLVQPPEIPVSSDLPRRVKRPIGPDLIDPQTPNSD